MSVSFTLLALFPRRPSWDDSVVFSATQRKEDFPESRMQKHLPQEATKRHEKGETERMAADRSTMESEARALGVGDGIALVLVAIPSPLAL